MISFGSVLILTPFFEVMAAGYGDTGWGITATVTNAWQSVVCTVGSWMSIAPAYCGYEEKAANKPTVPKTPSLNTVISRDSIGSRQIAEPVQTSRFLSPTVPSVSGKADIQSIVNEAVAVALSKLQIPANQSPSPADITGRASTSPTNYANTIPPDIYRFVSDQASSNGYSAGQAVSNSASAITSAYTSAISDAVTGGLTAFDGSTLHAGTSTLGQLTAGSTTLSSLNVSGNAAVTGALTVGSLVSGGQTIGGNFGVSGTTTLATTTVSNLSASTMSIGSLSGILYGNNGIVGTTSLSSLTSNIISTQGNTITSNINGVQASALLPYASASSDG